jgi:hypothetical protein|nr:MAG TPA: acetyl-coA carboxylase zinc finger domain protein [Caudoviricetes sp.]
MKHQKEWRTCDRCGKEIKLTLVRRGTGTIREKSKNAMIMKPKKML